MIVWVCMLVCVVYAGVCACVPLLCTHIRHTVSFRVYDIGNTGSIDRSEIKQFLVALIQDNPDLALDEAAIDQIIDQACTVLGCSHHHHHHCHIKTTLPTTNTRADIRGGGCGKWQNQPRAMATPRRGQPPNDQLYDSAGAQSTHHKIPSHIVITPRAARTLSVQDSIRRGLACRKYRRDLSARNGPCAAAL